MKIFQTTQFVFTKNKTLKKKKFYACVDRVINDFFVDNDTFQKVYDSNYFIQAQGGKKIIKVRLPNKTMNQGKSGGYRLIIACNSNTTSVVLLTIYPKLGKLSKSDLETGELTKLLKGLKTNISEKKLIAYKLATKTSTPKKIIKKTD